MEYYSILNNVINYFQHKRNPIDYYKLDVYSLRNYESQDKALQKVDHGLRI